MQRCGEIGQLQHRKTVNNSSDGSILRFVLKYRETATYMDLSLTQAILYTKQQYLTHKTKYSRFLLDKAT